MSDPRYDKLAKLLVEYSCALKKGESVFIDVADIPDRMTIALVRAARKVGANPIVETRQSRTGVHRHSRCGKHQRIERRAA